MNTRLPPQVFAAVDLGSNSFHMLIARYDYGQLEVIDREREMVRLAAGLTGSGKISRKVADGALDCLRRFGNLTRDMHAGVVRAVGTDALRKATNARAFLDAAEKILGHPITVISGEDEARLVYLGAVQSLPRLDGQRLVVDIGGGSTELILGRQFEPRVLHSLNLGCVGLTEKFFRDGKISDKRWKRARRAAADELKQLRTSLGDWDEAVGTSGTVRCIQRVLREQGWSAGSISQPSLKELGQYIIAKGHLDRLDLKGLSTRRKPVFPGGVVLLQAVFSELKIERMQAARGALREGLVYDMLTESYPNFRFQP